jgi:lysyl-tRNA synthetase class II
MPTYQDLMDLTEKMFAALAREITGSEGSPIRGKKSTWAGNGSD